MAGREIGHADVSYPLIPPDSPAWNYGLLVGGLLVTLSLRVDLRGTARRLVRTFES